MGAAEVKLFRRLNAFDFAFIVTVATAAVGFALTRAGYAGVDKVIQGRAKVAIEVFIMGVKTSDLNIFKVGELAAITIRNQPVHPPMTIAAVKHWQKKASFLAPDGRKAVAFPDPSQPLAHDFLVTVTDEAEVTPDGYVVRGNKVKIGNLIELESFKYRVQGVVTNIHPQPE